MHHMYPISKGDQLCPLGFHPQVRWPTRCKRCFRDYKEHGGKRSEDVIASSPSLSDSSNSRKRENGSSLDKSIGSRNWTSTSNLSSSNNTDNVNRINTPKRPSSWTSTPDLDEKEKDNKIDVVINLALPRRRHTTTLDISDDPDSGHIVEESITIKRPPIPPSQQQQQQQQITKEAPADLVLLRSDSLAERARKMQLLKKQNSLERENSRDRSITRERSPSVEVQVKKKTDSTRKEHPPPPIPPTRSHSDAIAKSQDVKFLIQIKDTQSKKNKQLDDNLSVTTESTDTTLINTKVDNELMEQIESLKRELDVTKTRAERAERDKSDILLRRLASMDTVPNRTAASEALKLQQKVNELKQTVEDLQDEKKVYSLKVKELEFDLSNRPTKNIEEELRKKLLAAEQLCEELMDENEDMKKELKNMESEIDEMQDNFREDQADEYTTTRKELEQTTKNCRILSFKLKKSERRIEQFELEKQTAAAQVNLELTNRIKTLEEELRIANEVSRQLQTEAEKNQKTLGKNKTPNIGVIGKSTSADGKYTRASLTRGGSQEDPVQLLRDLQDSMERETDLREQLKFAEEEAETLRKKASRVEDENESLMIQLKKMATKARSRKLSPTSPARLTLEAPVEKDEGISDEEDPAELRVLLELNEQEAAQLRRKVEELETDNEANKKQIKELQEKIKLSNSNNNLTSNNKESVTATTKSKLPSFLSKSTSLSTNDKRCKDLEQEVSELKTQLKDKNIKLENLTKTRGSVDKLDSSGGIDLKRKLEIVEQEANILRNKVPTLEYEIEKITGENKKLVLQIARTARKDSVATTAANDSSTTTAKNSEVNKLKETIVRVEKEKDSLATKLKTILEIPVDKLPERIPKKITDLSTKMQLQKIIVELEDEIKEMRALVVRTGANRLEKLEKEKETTEKELKDIRQELNSTNTELKNFKSSKKDITSAHSNKITELEQKLKKSDDENVKLKNKIKDLDDKLSKQESMLKQNEATKTLTDSQIKFDKEKIVKLEKDFDKEKKERTRWESKVAEIDSDFAAYKKNAEKLKSSQDKEISALKLKLTSSESSGGGQTKKVQELQKQNDTLQQDLIRETKKASDLTGKYEQLEEEHLLAKAQLTTEKEHLQTDLTTSKSKLSKLETEHQKFRKEHLDVSKRYADSLTRIKDFEVKASKFSTIEHERNRLKTKIEELDHDLTKLKKENAMNQDLGMQMKKENDDLRKKLSDFEKLNKVQHSFTDQTQNLEQEIKKLQAKLESTEMTGKSDVAATRLRYEQQIKNLQTEMNSLQRQCEKFKRDRDTFKQLLEAAQKTIRDLKSNSGRLSRASINSGDEDDKSKIITLEQQIGCLEDELCEARLETSKLKTELVSEKSMSEIKISEMTSRLNEYEEERLVGTGRSKIPGMKTKLELSWQKEREDQQRLLQETSTLARDLRQTLFEVERERDKERLESKRKQDQLKKANDEELEEGRKKISELQCDLLELRDAHAKLRTSNEKLRRERERYERDRDNANKRRMEQDGERKVGALLQTVDELVKYAPDIKIVSNSVAQNNLKSQNQSQQQQQQQRLQPQPPQRNNRSRSPSPSSNTIQISNVLARLAEASEELRRYQRLSEEDREREKMKRSSMRRAASTENETPEMLRHQFRVSRSSTHNGSLYRKSLSLDQTNQTEQTIWKRGGGGGGGGGDEEDSMSSMQSIDSEFSGMDSRLSGGSTQSDMIRGTVRKKKKGLMGKLRSLTKSKGTESEGSHQGSDSDVSMSNDLRSNKNNLKGKFSGMFKRAGSTPRSDSTERHLDNSQERPVAVRTVNLSSNNQQQQQQQQQQPPPTTPRLHRIAKPPTSSSATTTPVVLRKIK